MKRYLVTGAVWVLMLAAVIVYACFAAFAYHGEHLFIRAELGRKTISDYEKFLTGAYYRNPYNIEVTLRLAQVMQARGKHNTTRSMLSESSVTEARWQGWELLGATWERHAFSDAGTMEDAERGASLYDRVLAAHPSYERGLERRGLLALKMGHWNSVGHVANQLLTLNASNSNAIYFRGRMAEGIGDYGNALNAYARLSSLSGSDPGALYSQRELVERLKSLEKVVED